MKRGELTNGEMFVSFFLSDVLRGLPPLPEALRPTVLRHALPLHFRAMEQGARANGKGWI